MSFLLQVADADEARGKLQMRQVHCNPAEIVLSLQVMTVRDRTVNAAIGAVIQNVEILSPSSLGQRHACQSTAFFFILPIFLFRRSRASRRLRRRRATSPRQNSKGAAIAFTEQARCTLALRHPRRESASHTRRQITGASKVTRDHKL